ncbi:hypothetical protein PAHAL_4G226100 [Panicum hallii]|uniref:C2H2-type domain-containing protein n=1 Tax=Panicum hallii TaxID=206008 RepID=A0A2S3HJM7_9POAL|nr:hypothetical protein PAHAL_4G226100 [Panicum hallii]
MSKGSLLCSLVLLQVCIAQLSLVSGSLLTGGQIGGNLLCQDPIRRAWLMSSHGRDEFEGHNADFIFDEELADEGVDTSDDRGVLVAVGEAGAEEEEGLLPSDGDDEGGDNSGGTKDSSGSGGDVECPECGKFFKSDKSMFGHLRSHPNKGYKGTTPPVKKLKLSPETAATAATSSSSSSQDNKQATQVLPPPPSFGKLDAIGQAEGGIRGSATGYAAAKIKGNNDGNVGNYDEHSGSFVKIPKKRRNMPKEVSEAHRKKAKFVPTLKEKRPYICKHCKAEFSMHQALGGHMAGHHKEKVVPALDDSSLRAHQSMAAESQNAKEQVGGGDEDDNSWHGNDLSPPRGQFSIVLDVPWQCGQASGGQMRQHSKRNDGLSSPPVVPVATPTPTDDGDGRRLFDIDLNVKVPEQE